ncbi:MAG: hypothetical protein WA003_05390, partial [Desulfuromonadaceae bacterium]
MGTDEKYPNEKMPLIRALSGMSSSIEDMEIRKPDGSILIEVVGNPLVDEKGTLQYAITAFSNITERKQAEQALAAHAEQLEIANKNLEGLSHSLRKASEELETKVRERTAALNEATQRLQLATTSGGLGIWDWDIQSDEMIWDDRMFE